MIECTAKGSEAFAGLANSIIDALGELGVHSATVQKGCHLRLIRMEPNILQEFHDVTFHSIHVKTLVRMARVQRGPHDGELQDHVMPIITIMLRN